MARWVGLGIAAAALALLLGVAGGREPGDRPAGDSPRAAMQGYLSAVRAGDDDRAAGYLDLRRVPRGRLADLGPSLARQLGVVVDQALLIATESLSDDPEGQQDDGLAPGTDRVGVIDSRRGPVEMLLQRVPGEDGTPVWKIAAATVAQVPALYREFGYGRLGDLLPPVLLDVRVLEIALWQWIGLLLAVVVAYAISWLVAAGLVRLVRPIVARSRTRLDEKLLDTAGGPLRLAIGLLLFATGVLALSLPIAVRQVFVGLGTAAAIFTVAWLAVRVIDVFAGLVADGLTARGRTTAIAMVPVGEKAAKAIVAGFAVIAILQNIGINVTGILAGLGIGGLAVALAGQKTIENLFGGVTLVLDQPVRVGDFCRFGDTLGTVEEIGLRSTRVRTLDRTVVAVPNAEFSALQLENFARRDRIWLHTTLGLRYETTPDQLRYVLVEIRSMLYAHPRVDPDPARIRFVGFGAYSLDCEIFAYVLTADYGEFLAIREDIFLRIMDIVAASGSGFAFPSQTAYLGWDTGLDEARSRAAEAEVRARRERGEVYLPDFPAEKIAALRNTLPYPPDRAATTSSPG